MRDCKSLILSKSWNGRKLAAASVFIACFLFNLNGGFIEISSASGEASVPPKASTHVIKTIAGNGKAAFEGDGGPADQASLQNPRGIVLDAAGNVYVSDSTNNRVRKIDIKTGVISTYAGNGVRDSKGNGGPAVNASLAFPIGLAMDKKGNLFIADARNQQIRRVDGKTGIISVVAGNGIRGFGGNGGPAVAAMLSYPTGVALDEHGNVFIADSENGSIRKVDVKTGIIDSILGKAPPGQKHEQGTPSLRGLFVNPYSLVYDGKGNLYVTDSYLERVKKVALSNIKVTVVAGAESNTTRKQHCGDEGPANAACLAQPAGLALDKAGNLYIADINNNRVRRVDAKTKHIATIAGTGNRNSSGDGGGALMAELSSPTDVAVDSKGRVYIVESNSNRVRVVEAQTK